VSRRIRHPGHAIEWPAWVNALEDETLWDLVVHAIIARRVALRSGADERGLQVPDAMMDEIAEQRVKDAAARRRAELALRTYELATRSASRRAQ
jgi:hypothetical protein